MQVILTAVPRAQQMHKDVFLQVHPPKLYPLEKDNLEWCWTRKHSRSFNSGHSFIDPTCFTGQCYLFRVTSSSTFIMSSVKSIYIQSSIRIDTGRSKFEQQTDSLCFLPVDPMDRNHKDLDAIELEVPRLNLFNAYKAWKRFQDAVYYVIFNFDLKEGVAITIERFHSSRNTLQFIFSESCSDGNWRSHARERSCLISAPSKDFFGTWLDERIGSRSCSTTRWRSCSTIPQFPIKPTKSKPRSW